MAFKKGNNPWNKGTKGTCKSNSGSFQRGQGLGINNHFYNKKHSEITKRKMKQPRNGGRIIHQKYIFLYMPEHPYKTMRIYYPEHRYSAECILERFLDPVEQIHHIDKDPSNNLPENLYLFSSKSEHQKFHKNPYLLKSNLF